MDSESPLLLLFFLFPLRFFFSLLSSSTVPNVDRELSGENVSNVANIGDDGDTNGFVGSFSDDGSCLIIFGDVVAIIGEPFFSKLTEIPFNKHFSSNS